VRTPRKKPAAAQESRGSLDGPSASGHRETGTRPARRPRWLPRPGLLLAVLVVAVVAVLVLRERSAQHDFLTALHRVRPGRLPWLVVALGAEAGSFMAYAMAQRRLLAAGGARLRRRTLFALTFATTSISSLLPVGVLPSSAWLISQYHRRGVSIPLAAWSFLAGGFASTVSILALLLVGAGVADIGSRPVLVVSFVILVAGSAAFVVAAHHLHDLERWLGRRHARRGLRLVKWLAGRTVAVVRFRATFRGGAEVITFSVVNWLFDTVCLGASFAFLGLPVPWRTVVFAYAVSQVAAGLVPVPAGIGVVAGGLVGAFTLAGVPAGDALLASVVYRVVSYWLVAALGSLAVVWISHRPVGPPAQQGPDREGGPAATELPSVLTGTSARAEDPAPEGDVERRDRREAS
jgi:putative heme transporter